MVRFAVVLLLLAACRDGESEQPDPSGATCADPRFPVGIFDPGKPLGMESYSGGFAVADFDGDSHNDMVIAAADGVVSVMRGTDTGFATGTPYPMGLAATASVLRMVAGDLDNDSDVDAVAFAMDYSAGTGSVTVLVNAGDATFTVGSSYPTLYGLALALGDLDGDGLLDLVVSNRTSNLVSIFKNLGGATFAARTDIPNGGAADYDGNDVALADLNSDGRLDIVTTANSGDIAVLLGGASGFTSTIVPVTPAADEPSFGVRALATADMNGDGAIDIVASYASAEHDDVAVFVGANGTFTQSAPVRVGAFATPVRVGDIDGDAHPDVVVGHTTGDAPYGVLHNAGNGTLSAEALQDLHTTAQWIALANVGGDAALDVTFSSAQGIAVVTGHSDGRFEVPLTIAPPATTGIATDIDGDGHQDLVLGVSDGVAVLRGNGAGTFAPAELYAIATPLTIVASDVDGDGRKDLVVGTMPPLTTGSTVVILLGTTDGFGAPKTFATSAAPRSIAVGDLDGDALPDLVVGASGFTDHSIQLAGAREVFLNEGGGAFSLASSTPGATALVQLLDVNRDDVLDLIESRDGGTSLELGRNNGTFAPGTSLPAARYTLLDMNHDGALDLVGSGPSLSVAYGKGNGTYEPAVELATLTGGKTIADINGDGFFDIATSALQLELRLGKPDGTFGEVRRYWSTGAGYAPITADFNEDGLADLSNLSDGTTTGVEIRLQHCGN